MTRSIETESDRISSALTLLGSSEVSRLSAFFSAHPTINVAAVTEEFKKRNNKPVTGSQLGLLSIAYNQAHSSNS